MIIIALDTNLLDKTRLKNFQTQSMAILTATTDDTDTNTGPDLTYEKLYYKINIFVLIFSIFQNNLSEWIENEKYRKPSIASRGTHFG